MFLWVSIVLCDSLWISTGFGMVFNDCPFQWISFGSLLVFKRCPPVFLYVFNGFPLMFNEFPLVCN